MMIKYSEKNGALMKHIILALALIISHASLNAHCQIPCGIYHDQMVVQGLEEDVETLAKSVNEIQSNPRRTAQDNNQLVRWVLEHRLVNCYAQKKFYHELYSRFHNY